MTGAVRPELRVLFLGAGKRLSLLERFIAAAKAEDVQLGMWCLERESRVPVAEVAEIIVGPAFGDPSFEDFLLAAASEHKIDLVLPNMDSATVALSAARDALRKSGVHAVVSDAALCRAMEDKVEADAWFRARGVAVPATDSFPAIVKHRRGFGARDQAVVRDREELARFLGTRSPGDYLTQKFIPGQEYTVDAYVDRAGKFVGALSRKRLKVIDGEVEVSETHRHPEILSVTERLFADKGWEGPITLQFIDSKDGVVAIEINPRFGGGVTHAIHCGLDMPRWLLREHLHRPLSPAPSWPDGSLMTRCRRDVFLWS